MTLYLSRGSIAFVTSLLMIAYGCGDSGTQVDVVYPGKIHGAAPTETPQQNDPPRETTDVTSPTVPEAPQANGEDP